MFMESIFIKNEVCMDTEKMVLGFLMSGPKTGYKIKTITGELMVAYDLSLNQIYPVLRKLEAADLIKKEIVFQVGKPNKNVYTITENGKAKFHQTITATPLPVNYHLDFLTKMFFFRFLSRQEVIQQFENEIISIDEQLEELEARQIAVTRDDDEDGTFIYETIVHFIKALKKRYEKELKRRLEKLDNEK